MNESHRNALNSEIAKLKDTGAQFLTWKQVTETPDFKEYGQNRGLRLAFKKGDILHFPSLDEAVFFTTTFKSGGNTYHVLKTLVVIESKKYGASVKEVPAAILCRIPTLESEQELLWQNNTLGYKLANADADYIRLMIMCEIGDVKVTWVSGENGEPTLHTDHWITDKETKERTCIKDSDTLPECDRVPLKCYKFSPVKAA